jgi:hypothetical protein
MPARRPTIVLGLAALLLAAAAAADQRTDLARCLTRKGVTLYGATWCPACEKQLEAFGRAADYLDYVECSLDGTGFVAPECEDADVKSFPTWEFGDGSRQTGQLSFARLSKKSGCPLTAPEGGR